MMDKYEQEARERLSITAEDIEKYPALFNDRAVYFELAVSKVAQALRERDKEIERLGQLVQQSDPIMIETPFPVDDADAEIAKLKEQVAIPRDTMDDGGPLFPQTVEQYDPLTGITHRTQRDGASQRDWFASEEKSTPPPDWCSQRFDIVGALFEYLPWHEQQIALSEWRYEMADAMLKAKKKKL